MKTTIIHHILISTATVALTACEKELDIKYHDIDPITVIEATLTQDGTAVRITETTPMDEAMNRTPLTDATVTVTDLTSGASSALTISDDGIYHLPEPGIQDHTYMLQVSRNGNTYQATSVMGTPVEIIGIEFNWIKMPYDHVAVLQVSIGDNEETEGECYWLRTYRNGEIYKWAVFRDNMAYNGRIDEAMMTSRMDTAEEDEEDVLRDGDIVTATVVPVSRAMYDYLEGLGNDSNSSRMFGGGFCLGYFLAAPVSTATITFHPEEIPYQ